MNLPTTTFKEQQSERFVAFFLSDLHLSPHNQDHIDQLEGFIDDVLALSYPVKLFFLGDVFDLWVGTASPVEKQVQSLLGKLKSLQDQGGQVYFFEGNHDLHLDVYFEKKWNFSVVKDHWQGDIAGLKVRLEHGDLFDPDDKGYLFLRRFLRKSWVRFLLIYLIPDPVINGVGNFFSQQSSKNTKNKHTVSSAQQSKVEEKLKAYATLRNETDGLDLLICGHTHNQNLYQLPSGQLINLGTWQDNKPKALALTENQNTLWFSL